MKQLTTFALIALAACGGVTNNDEIDPGVDAGIDDGEDGDLTPPTVLSTTPPDGAAGIDADASITIAFSEPMDQASVEAAWSSGDLPPDQVQFVWNDNSDTVTVIPDAPLPLAEGTGLDPSQVAPLQIDYTINTGARDLAGNELERPANVAFETRRRLTVDLAQLPSLTRTMRADAVVFAEGAVTLTSGDSSANLQMKIFASFEVPDFPAGAEIEVAELRGSQNSTINTPYVLGDLEAFHINAATIDTNAFDGALAALGTFSDSEAAGARSLRVTSAFLDDLANRAVRGDRTQYRLEFPTETNSNGAADEARYAKSSFALAVTYLVD